MDSLLGRAKGEAKTTERPLCELIQKAILALGRYPSVLELSNDKIELYVSCVQSLTSPPFSWHCMPFGHYCECS